MILLGVNVDHIATIRQARGGVEPDPASAAVLAMLNGADSITVHLREDRRHIQDRDVRIIRQLVETLNLEMANEKGVMAMALEIKPDQVTLVPEKREELTTEGGLDVARDLKNLTIATEKLKGAGIRVSMFIEACPKQVEASAKAGAWGVEFHTGTYANATDCNDKKRCLQQIKDASQLAQEKGLTVLAGHGLNYHNVRPIAAITGMHELNIGHSIISRAVLTGLPEAVKEMKRLMENL